MSDALAGIIAALIGLIGYYITMWGTRKMELEKIDKEAKIRQEESRREFLILIIKDEKEFLSVRKEAAKEYLEKGYNGAIKKYIYEIGLDK
ncbi:MAG: hypothetical protein Ta2D_10990 [Rickettsiales bacterium]|nr:MAG: hypothetical protein Ta2D_10990 [Rickettsiales bacterium]